jgi:hypothetical protein
MFSNTRVDADGVGFEEISRLVANLLKTGRVGTADMQARTFVNGNAIVNTGNTGREEYFIGPSRADKRAVKGNLFFQLMALLLPIF